MINNSRNAFTAFDRLTRDLENWFRDPAGRLESFSDLFDFEDKNLQVDLHEDDDNFYARFEVPGVSKKNVEVELDQGRLSVKATRLEKDEEGEDAEHVMTRSIDLPDTVDSESIKAKMADGLLTLTLPKREETKPRTISVK